MPADCERTRKRFPDLVEGAADNETRGHLAGCAACTESFESLESMLRELEALDGDEAPDPGEQYWDEFLFSIRRRLEPARQRRVSRTLPAIAACAAMIMILVSLAALYTPGPSPGSSIDDVFEIARRLPPEESRRLAESTADLLGIMTAGPDLAGDLDLEEVIEAIDRIQHPGGLTDLWHDHELEEMILHLDESQAAALKQELEVARTAEPGRRL